MDYYEKFSEMKKGESYHMTNGTLNIRFTKIEDYLFLIVVSIYLEELEEAKHFNNLVTTMSASLIAEKLS